MSKWLSKAEEFELITASHKGCQKAKVSLYNAYESQIHMMARKYSSSEFPHQELFQCAAVGFFNAVERFDVNHNAGARLVSYSYDYMRDQVLLFVNGNKRAYKIHTTKGQSKVFHNLGKYKGSGKWLSPLERKEMVKDLGVKESEIIEVEKRLLSQEVRINDQQDEDTKQEDKIASDALSPEQIVLESDYEQYRSEKLNDAIMSLTEKNQIIVRSRFLNKEGKVSLKELAKKFGTSYQAVDQNQKNALSKIKKSLEESMAEYLAH